MSAATQGDGAGRAGTLGKYGRLGSGGMREPVGFTKLGEIKRPPASAASRSPTRPASTPARAAPPSSAPESPKPVLDSTDPRATP